MAKSMISSENLYGLQDRGFLNSSTLGTANAVTITDQTSKTLDSLARPFSVAREVFGSRSDKREPGPSLGLTLGTTAPGPETYHVCQTSSDVGSPFLSSFTRWSGPNFSWRQPRSRHKGQDLADGPKASGGVLGREKTSRCLQNHNENVRGWTQ